MHVDWALVECVCLQARSPQDIIPRALVDTLVRLLHGGAAPVRLCPILVPVASCWQLHAGKQHCMVTQA